MKTATDYLKLVFKVHSISSSSLAMLESISGRGAAETVAECGYFKIYTINI